MTNNTLLRKEIIEIHRNPNLTAGQKSLRIQEILSKDYHLSKKNQTIKCNSSQSIGYDVVPSFYSNSNILGCSHYKKKCKIKNECCNKWYVCRICHDEDSDHSINRYSIKEMCCMMCNSVQETAKKCINCKEDMACYYCDICHLWDDDATKNIYHCQKCGLCRLSQGNNFFHCDKCNVCMAIKLKGNHKCIEKNLESNCPICHEYMFTSTKTIIFMKCGHCIHQCCFKKHVEKSYICPICLKSLGDMTSLFKKIEETLKEQIMPIEYQKSTTEILCNDCERKLIVPFHFQYHKCSNCNSFNTSVLKVFHKDK